MVAKRFISDVAFLSFDVGSSDHCDAEVTKCRIVHLARERELGLDRRETG